MTGNKTTFWNFIQENRIEIPIIQRDYAQGRLGKEYLRASFLKNLKDALDDKLQNSEKELKLDFVYGTIEQGRLQPLDGQQRLTTLWLLHWYIALRAGKLREVIVSQEESQKPKVSEVLSNFTYETRISSREFCEHLCNENNFQSYTCADGSYSDGCTSISIVDFITTQTWFYSVWKYDPTIQSMLRMLGGTKINNKKGEDIIDGIEELFKETDIGTFETYWQKLACNSPIVFYYLPLKEFGLSDDLYIKMNARGKQLTTLENFKADLIGYIQEMAESEQDNCEWKNLLNAKNGIPIKMDTTWTDLFWMNRSELKKIDEIYFAFLNRYILNSLISSGSSANEIEANKTFIYLYNKGNDTALQYTGFEIYKIPGLETILRKLRTTLENFHTFTSKMDGQKLEEIQKLFFPSWDNQNNFRFVPEYKEDSITDLTQSQRVIFHAVCKYFEQGEYEEKSFKRWMRVVWNLVENGNINSIESMISSLKLIDELSSHSHDIYDFLAKDEPIKSESASEQQKEEREKAKKIIEDASWEEKIIKAEKYAFFKGGIRFLFRDENDECNWSDFDKKWENVRNFFQDNSPYKKACVLLRYFISLFTDWSLFGGMTFDNENNSWRSVLVNKKWSKPIHELLTSDRIEVTKGYKSPLEGLEAKFQEDLVTTSLLEHIEKGSYLRGNGYYALYPYNVKADWKKYVIANTRNEILSSLYGGKIMSDDGKYEQSGKIYTDQKINGCNFFWGWNIKFKYVKEGTPYTFHWQSWNWIDMYDGDTRLLDKENSRTDKKLTIDACKINNPEDLTRELERCINDYIEYQKQLQTNIESNATP